MKTNTEKGDNNEGSYGISLRSILINGGAALHGMKVVFLKKGTAHITISKRII